MINCKSVENCTDFVIVIYVRPEKANESLFLQVISRLLKTADFTGQNMFFFVVMYYPNVLQICVNVERMSDTVHGKGRRNP